VEDGTEGALLSQKRAPGDGEITVRVGCEVAVSDLGERGMSRGHTVAVQGEL